MVIFGSQLKDNIKFLKSLDLDMIVVVAFGYILPKELINLPKFGCINLHASLLPRWRGAAPIQRAIMAGDKNTGLTVMLMDEGLDTGNIISKIYFKCLIDHASIQFKFFIKSRSFLNLSLKAFFFC